MIKCRHCGEKYDENAYYCPFCGADKPEKDNQEILIRVVAIACAAVVLVVIGLRILFEPVKNELSKYAAYKNEIAGNLAELLEQADDEEDLLDESSYENGLPEINLFSINNEYLDSQTFYREIEGQEIIVDEDKYAEMESLALSYYENKQWEELVQIFRQYSLYSLPKEVINMAEYYGSIVRARESLETIKNVDTKKDIDIRNEVKYLIYDSSRVNKFVEWYAMDGENEDVYMVINEEAIYYLREICGFEPEDIDYYYMERDDAIADFYASKVIKKIYEDIYGIDSRDAQDQVDKDFNALCNAVIQYFDEKEWDKLKTIMSVAELKELYPSYNDVATCYSNLAYANEYYNYVRNDYDEEYAYSDIEKIVIYSVYTAEISMDYVEHDYDAAMIIEEFSDAAYMFLYDICEYDEEDIIGIMKLEHWSGEEWDKYIEKAYDNILRKR